MSLLQYHERETIERKLSVSADQAPNLHSKDAAALEERFDIKATAALLAARSAAVAATAAAAAAGAPARRFSVALQFPDSMLPDSPAVAAELQRESGIADIFVLADTTFGSCCIDAVAAQHIDADFIVHYGPSCLSRPTSACPVLLVLERAPVNVELIANHFTSQFGSALDEPVLMLCDAMYYHAMEPLKERLLAAGFRSIIWPTIQTIYNTSPSEDAVTAEADGSLIREAQGRRYRLENGVTIADLSLYYIGGESLTLTNLLMTHSLAKQVITFDPATGTGRVEVGRVNKLLMRRYYMVQKAKDADVIGIVVGTLGLASYLPVIQNVKRLILASGKKPYMLAVGKPSPAKLGNFLEIDVFVLIACPENALLESRDFHRPIITPHELSVALNPDAEWDVSKYELDLVSIDRQLSIDADAALERQNQRLAQYNARIVDGGDVGSRNDDMSDDEEPHFSLITGKYKQRKKYVSVVASDEPTVAATTDGTVATRSLESTVSRYVSTSAAAEYLNEKRTFRGLEMQLGETGIADVQEGRRGVARGYTHSQTDDKA